MKILITGSSGYVGFVFSRFFTERGVPVVGLDIAPNPAWDGHELFRFRACDVTQEDALQTLFRAERPTHVLHLAYLMSPLHDTKRERDIDVGGSINVLQAADRTETVQQLVLLSSTSVYGARPDNRLWIPETAPLRPGAYRYGIHKKEVEERWQSHRKRESLRIVILRMCTAVGPTYHKKGGVVALLAHARVLPKLAGRYCEVQFIHEDDLTSLFDLIVHDAEVEGVFNLAPDSYATTRELAPKTVFVPVPLGLARGLVSVLWKLHLSGSMASAMDLSTYGIVADPAKLMRRYGYRFQYGTLDAFRSTVIERKARGTL